MCCENWNWQRLRFLTSIIYSGIFQWFFVHDKIWSFIYETIIEKEIGFDSLTILKILTAPLTQLVRVSVLYAGSYEFESHMEYKRKIVIPVTI